MKKPPRVETVTAFQVALCDHQKVKLMVRNNG
jgi:hypothetical protein